MKLKLELNTEQKFWSVKKGEQILGYIFLDYLEQVKSIVLFTCSEEEELLILRLSCSHIANYLRCRHHVPYHFLPLINEISPNKNLTENDSKKIMSFSEIDERLTEASTDEMKKLLETLHIPLINGIVKSFDEAIQLSIAQVVLSNDTTLNCKGLKYEWMNDAIRLEFKSKQLFEFWNHTSEPRSGFDLHIVPPYHPIFSKKKPLSINGSTDAFIRGIAVRMIYSPVESRTVKDCWNTWGHVNHPFKITGSSFELSVNRISILSQEGIDELSGVLRATLGLSGEYIAIIGGFNPPYLCPHNRLNELGVPLDKRVHIRGSEADCVWEYKTLKQEGLLQEAYIPEWFIKEDWLGFYETAEFTHGLY